MKRLLVVSPHPDDETLGAAGTLLRARKLGAKIYWLNITNMKEDYGYPAKLVRQRTKEMKKVAGFLKFNKTFDLGLKPADMDRIPRAQLVAEISRVISRVKPDTILVPFRYDAHSDHKVVFDAVAAGAKKFRHPYIKRILAMEILSETNFSLKNKGFRPNYFFDIEDGLKDKIRIMRTYRSEFKKHPFPRSAESIRSLAILRGSQAGCRHAEAFEIVKWVE